MSAAIVGVIGAKYKHPNINAEISPMFANDFFGIVWQLRQFVIILLNVTFINGALYIRVCI